MKLRRFLVILGIVAMGCSSSEEQPSKGPTNPALGKTISNEFGTLSFHQGVVFPEETAGYQGIDAVGHDDGTETVTLRYSGATPSYPQNTVIVGYLQPPYYFRRVLASRPVAGGVELDVEMPPLTDVVAEADVSAYLPVEDDPQALVLQILSSFHIRTGA
jgi:hypothetical protein